MWDFLEHSQGPHCAENWMSFHPVSYSDWNARQIATHMKKILFGCKKEWECISHRSKKEKKCKNKQKTKKGSFQRKLNSYTTHLILHDCLHTEQAWLVSHSKPHKVRIRSGPEKSCP